MQVKFTVGEFAKLHHISKQTLIYYDRIGLFQPQITDKQNGYRYYTAEQLETLDTIFILKEIGLPLKEIRLFLQKRAPERALELLSQQQQTLEQKICRLQQIQNKLQYKIASLQEAIHTIPSLQVTFVSLPAQYLFTQEIASPYRMLETDLAVKNLLNRVTADNLIYDYQIGAMVPPEHLLNGRFTEATKVFAPMQWPSAGEEESLSTSILLRPAGQYAVCYHYGDYDSLGCSYQRLLAEIARTGRKILGDSYEYNLFDNLTSLHEKDYLTKIVIQVEENPMAAKANGGEDSM